MPGYISLHRDIQKHWLYKEERVFSRYEAWLDILMRVNHTEGKVTHNGTLETVQRGSTIWSMGDMEKHWGWSNKKVKRFLDCLANDQMLTYKSTTKKTYLTVINYDSYQDSDNTKAPPKHHESTTEAFQKHTNNNELIMTNNENNVKDKKNTGPKKEKDDSTKINYASNVKLKLEEYEKLISDNGEEAVTEMIDILNTYKVSKGATYKSDYMTMTKNGWVLKRYQEEQARKLRVIQGGGNGGKYGRSSNRVSKTTTEFDEEFESLIIGTPV